MRKIITLLSTIMLSLAATAKGELRHLVFFKFKADATAEQISAVEKAFAALPASIPQIKSFEWGTDVSKEGKAKGFTHGFQLTFDDEKALEAYLPHPAHQEFVKLVGPIVEDVFVFDYVAK